MMNEVKKEFTKTAEKAVTFAFECGLNMVDGKAISAILSVILDSELICDRKDQIATMRIAADLFVQEIAIRAYQNKSSVNLLN